MKKVLWYRSIQFLRSCKVAYNKTYICEITTYFCSLTVIENIMHHFKMSGARMLCILFLFSFHPPFKDFQWKVRKPPNKKEKA